MDIKVGSFVRVIKPGETYSSYSGMFEKLGFRSKRSNPSFKTGTLAQVFAKANHETNPDKLLALVDGEGRECLISTEGVELANFARKNPIVELRINSQYVAKISEDKIEVGCQTIEKKEFEAVVRAAKKAGLLK